MSDTQPQELTPEARAILARARKSFLFSIGLLIVGFLAIGGALIFRSANMGGGGSSTGADYVIAYCDGGYTTNLLLEDVSDGKAWITYRYDGAELEPEHGGPARLLVPHLYFWKSAKWVRGLRLSDEDEPGFWESVGYHNHGDPWREQRYWGDG